MTRVPDFLRQPILDAYPANVCLVATTQPDGYSQVSPRGSVHVYNDKTLAYWDRGSGTTHDNVETGSKVTIYFRDMKLGRNGSNQLPLGGIARFYGSAEIHSEDGEIRERVWNGMIEVERERDPEKKGRAVLIHVERAEQLNHKPLTELED